MAQPAGAAKEKSGGKEKELAKQELTQQELVAVLTFFLG